MSTSKPVTETVILHLRDQHDFADVYAGRDPGSGPASLLTKLGDTVKAQKGCIRQFWGPQIENQNLFVWSIDWETFDDHRAFINSDAYKAFFTDVGEVFDLEVAAPLMTHTAFTSDVTAARQAAVTELAFFMMSKEASEEQRTRLEDSFMPVLKAATTAGPCSAFAVGWVFEEQQHPQATNGQAVALSGLLGWPSVEDHNEFRNTSEFLEAIEPVRSLALPPVQGKSMFHVNFHAVK